VFCPPKSKRKRIRKKARKDRKRWTFRYVRKQVHINGNWYVDPITYKQIQALWPVALDD